MYDVGVFKILRELPLIPEGLEQAGQPVDNGLTSRLINFRRDSVWSRSFANLKLTNSLQCLLSCWTLIEGRNQKSLWQVLECPLINGGLPVKQLAEMSRPALKDVCLVGKQGPIYCTNRSHGVRGRSIN